MPEDSSFRAISSEVINDEISTYRQEIAATYHYGPLPDHEVLEGYEKICPGAANRIIVMAENQSSHRQKMEQKIIAITDRNSIVGIVCAFILGMTIIVGGIYIVINSQTTGQTIAGTIFSGAGLASLVGTFIYGTSSSRKKHEDE